MNILTKRKIYVIIFVEGGDKMNQEEKKELKMLLDYIKSNIFHYGDNKKLPPILKKKINELALNENNEFVYTYKMILYSFMINKPKIEYAFSTKTFKNESHKINYMMVIVSNDMNSIKAQVESAQKHKDKLKNDITQAQYLSDNNVLKSEDRYVKKENSLLNSEVIKDLW